MTRLLTPIKLYRRGGRRAGTWRGRAWSNGIKQVAHFILREEVNAVGSPAFVGYCA